MGRIAHAYGGCHMGTTVAGLVLPGISHSQLDKHTTCPKAWYLSRVARVPRVPSVAGVAGTAAHSLTEIWDRQDCPDWSESDWDREASRLLDAEIEDTETRYKVPQDQWRVSGRATKEWPEKETIDWWRVQLPVMGERYAKWRKANPQFSIWITPDGEEAIELGIEVPLPGVEPLFRAFIDRVFVDGGTQTLVIVDLKFGAMTPEDLSQLARYRMAVELRYGVAPAFGGIWKGRTGELVPIFKDDKTLMPLSHLPSGVIAGDIADRWQLMKTGSYPAAPGRHCGWCDVRTACTWAKGAQAWKFDPAHPGFAQSQLALAT